MLQDKEVPSDASRPAGCSPGSPATNVTGSADEAADKQTLTSLERFRVPIGGQEIELQQLDYAHGGISLLRLRIREGKRFTIFDVDPVTARHWGEALVRWAQGQER